MLVEGTVVVVIYQLHQQYLVNLLREPMQRNSAEESLTMRIFLRSMLASLVVELERWSTRLLACQAQWEISLQAGETADLMHCYEQYVELRHLLARCSHLSKLLVKKQLRDLLGMNSGGDWLETLQERLAR